VGAESPRLLQARKGPEGGSIPRFNKSPRDAGYMKYKSSLKLD